MSVSWSAADAMTSNSKSACTALPIPPILVSTVPGTWAFDTMSRRVDSEILQRTYDENEEMLFRQSPTILAQFQGLRHELQNAATTPMRYLNKLSEIKDGDDDEWNQWNQIVQPYVENNDTWLSTPWLVAEFYLYRRLLECTGYFDPLSIGYKYDPFQTQKRSGLFSSIASAERVMKKIEALTKNNDFNKNSKWNRDGTAFAVELALWGNKMDLSLWPVSSTASKEQQQQQQQKETFSKVLEAAKENLLHDDTDELLELCEILQRNGGGNIDIIVDNAGFELVTDLVMADHLISNGIAKCVTFQLKSHPTFVSDAMEKDLLETVQYFQSLDGEESYPCCVRAGRRWASYLSSGKWTCKEDKFWVQGRAMWEMDEHLFSDLTSRCDLAFVKGDANYRRLLGDCAWDYTTSFQQIVGVYFPSPVCALRTLKSEVACGIDASQIQRASSLDDQWLVNGRFGVVHLGTGARPP